jgi:hypothetical protein
LEVYTPDFKNPEDGINQTDINQINPLTSTLLECGIPLDEIRERLDRATENNERNDVADKYEYAKNLSKAIVASLHDKIEPYVTFM